MCKTLEGCRALSGECIFAIGGTHQQKYDNVRSQLDGVTVWLLHTLYIYLSLLRNFILLDRFVQYFATKTRLL